MSRAFTPPDSLSKDDIRTIADVRRDIWTNGVKGLGIGSLAGFTTHSIIKLIQTKFYQTTKLNRNTAFLSVMLGGAIGSFVLATTTGKNQVHQLHPIYQRGNKNSINDDLVQEAKIHKQELQSFELSHKRGMSLHDRDVADHMRRETNRLYRRATLTQQMKAKHGGLSDSHGGHWIPDNNDNNNNDNDNN